MNSYYGKSRDALEPWCPLEKYQEADDGGSLCLYSDIFHWYLHTSIIMLVFWFLVFLVLSNSKPVLRKWSWKFIHSYQC